MCEGIGREYLYINVALGMVGFDVFDITRHRRMGQYRQRGIC